MSKLVEYGGKMIVRGRRTLLQTNPDLIEKIGKLIEDCYYPATAARALGINEQTLYKYMKYGEIHDKTHEDGEPCTLNCSENDVANRKLLTTIKRSQANYSLENMQEIKKHRPKNWMAAAWLQERTQPNEFGLKTRTEHTGEGGGPILHKLTSVEQRQRILKAANDALTLETTQDESGVFIPVQDES